MRVCCDKCYPICDFCKHFKHDVPFGGFGVCELNNDEKHCGDGCRWFYCSVQAKEDNKEVRTQNSLEELTVELVDMWKDNGVI